MKVFPQILSSTYVLTASGHYARPNDSTAMRPHIPGKRSVTSWGLEIMCTVMFMFIVPKLYLRIGWIFSKIYTSPRESLFVRYRSFSHGEEIWVLAVYATGREWNNFIIGEIWVYGEQRLNHSGITNMRFLNVTCAPVFFGLYFSTNKYKVLADEEDLNSFDSIRIWHYSYCYGSRLLL